MAGELVFITGATGFLGFAVLLKALRAGYSVRISVRLAAQATAIKSHHLIAPFSSALSFVVVPDITLPGAFDSALEGVSYIQHVASPLPNPTEDPENDIIIPAIHGTTSILNSALKYPAIKRVVITSSVVAILSNEAASSGSSVPLNSSSRVFPLPEAPFAGYDASASYRASKALALDATDRFVAEKKPGFGIVNVMPGYIIGRHELLTEAKALVSGSNAVVLSIVLKSEPNPGKQPFMVSYLGDVARVHVEALDEVKVKVGKGESKGFLIDGGSLRTGVQFNNAKEIARNLFPESVADGKLKLGGGIESAELVIESEETVETFGELKDYEYMVGEVVGQYLELLERD